MTRRPDWEARLNEYLGSVWDRPFAYGAHDCALHGASAVMAMTDEDPAAEYRGHYATRLGSLRALRRIGQGTLEASFDAKFDAIDLPLAKRGDLVMAGGSIGVCMGSFGLFVGGDEGYGLVRIERAEWTKAWAV